MWDTMSLCVRQRVSSGHADGHMTVFRPGNGGACWFQCAGFNWPAFVSFDGDE